MCGSLTHTPHILHNLLCTLGGMLLIARNLLHQDILRVDGRSDIRRIVNDLSDN